MGGAWFEQYFGSPDTVDEDEIARIATEEAGRQLGIAQKPMTTIVNIQKVRALCKEVHLQNI